MSSSDEIVQEIRKRGQRSHSCYAAPRCCSPDRLPQGILAVGDRYGRSPTHMPRPPCCTTLLSMQQRLLEGVGPGCSGLGTVALLRRDRKSTRLNSSHL